MFLDFRTDKEASLYIIN